MWEGADDRGDRGEKEARHFVHDLLHRAGVAPRFDCRSRGAAEAFGNADGSHGTDTQEGFGRVMGQTLKKALDLRDARGFNNDSKYKHDIVEAIDFKVQKIIELGQLAYKADELDPDSFLHVATRNGNSELSTILLLLGFPLHPADNINYKDDMGETLMATDCRMGNFEVFERLLKSGADVNVVRRDSKSALHLAVVSGKARSFEMFEALLEAKADVSVQDSMGETLMTAACGMGNFEVFEKLLKAGADVNVVHRDGKSVLHLAVASDSARSFEMFEALLKAGADLKLDMQDSMGETVMAAACRLGNFEVFERLLKSGADVNVVRRDGTSALQLAIVSGNARILNCMPKMIEYNESAEISYVRCLSLAFLAPNNIIRAGSKTGDQHLSC